MTPSNGSRPNEGLDGPRAPSSTTDTASVPTQRRTDHRTPTRSHAPELIRDMQQRLHGDGHDYADGSPHIRHHPIRSHIAETLQDVVREVLDARGECRVLEVGAGHGTFTDYVVSVGATAMVTEMSEPSVDRLRDRYRHNDNVTVVPDPDGAAASGVGPVDVVACISVLHHIPDYVGAARGWLGQIRPGGAFVSFQDPLWYPRRSRASRLGDRAAYLSWRIPRGELRRGTATAVRGLRGAYDESNPSDMVEYHVMRDGVDELALSALLEPTFRSVQIQRYWSTQGLCAQWIGGRVGSPNTFGLVARGHTAGH